MTPTLDAALLYVVHHDGVATTSSRAGTDLGQLSDIFMIMYFTIYYYEVPRRDSNVGPKPLSLLEFET